MPKEVKETEDYNTSLSMTLTKIQNELKAPKTLKNDFAKFNYRNIEQIQEEIKPLLLKYKVSLTLSDKMIMLGDRYYLEATAMLSDGAEVIDSVGYAREQLEKKGMDSAQITGGASSYARKYALQALFLIDDSKEDPDTKDNSEPVAKKEVTTPVKTSEPVKSPAPVKVYSLAEKAEMLKNSIKEAKNEEELKKVESIIANSLTFKKDNTLQDLIIAQRDSFTSSNK